MPAVPAGATITATTINWPKGVVDAPDAFHHRALLHLDIASGTLKVYDLRGKQTATYQLVPDQFTIKNNEVRGPLEDGGDIIVRPDKGCSCLGYRRTPKDPPPADLLK